MRNAFSAFEFLRGVGHAVLQKLRDLSINQSEYHRPFRLQTTCRRRRSRRSMSPASPGTRFHRRPTSCLRHRVPCRRATASCDAPLTRPTSRRAATPPISMARALSPARRTNRYTSRLILDRRHNCHATIPCTPATGRPRLLNRRARCPPLKK